MEHKKAILVVSFGSSVEEARNKAIAPIEHLVKETFKEYTVASAYTSNFIRGKLAKQGIYIDSALEGLEKLIQAGFTEILVQPLHILAGFEFEKIQDAVKIVSNEAVHIKLGKPLMTTEEDLDTIVHVLEHQDDTLTIYIGHGTDHPINHLYEKLEERLMSHRGLTFVGTVEEGPLPMLERFAQIFEQEKTVNHSTKIKLKPFLLVAGDHVIHDINGTEEDSWVSAFKAKNYEVVTDLRGLGEIQGFQQLFIQRITELIEEGE
jgi:sirohydrochlorin cobaltochelatase